MLRKFTFIAFHTARCRLFNCVVALICLCWLVSQDSAAEKPTTDGHLRQFNGETMGTTYHVTVDVGGRADSLAFEPTVIKRLVDELLADINRKMSTYDPKSEVSRFNQARQTDWFAVSAETALVVAEALRVNQASNGAFDITVGPLVNAWGFGPKKMSEADRLPTAEEIQVILPYVGSSRLEVRRDPPAIRKSDSRIEIDLSAIAKGYGVDAVAELLNANGFESHLVEIGGEVRAGLRKTDGTFWRVGIESPKSEMREVNHIVALENLSLASSGNYRNFFTRDGKTYGHTIDPRTGLPVEKNILGASIIAENCLKADAQATACMVLGVEEAKQFALNQESQALLFYADGEEIVETHSDDFPFAEVTIVKEPTDNQAKKKHGVFFPIFIAATAVFLIAIFIMSLGTIIGNRRIQGSCGALASSHKQDATSPCELCQKPVKDCPEKQAQTAKEG